MALMIPSGGLCVSTRTISAEVLALPILVLLGYCGDIQRGRPGTGEVLRELRNMEQATPQTQLQQQRPLQPPPPPPQTQESPVQPGPAKVSKRKRGDGDDGLEDEIVASRIEEHGTKAGPGNSVIWDYFEKYNVGNDSALRSIGICKLCRKQQDYAKVAK